MTELLANMTWWEPLAVVLAVAYLVLAIRQSIWCWPAGIGSALIYFWLMAVADLYMQSALQLFYIGMSAYGWWNWRAGQAKGKELPVTSRTLAFHFRVLMAIVSAGLVNGWLLARYSDAVMPYLDALTALGSIVATWLVARKVLQNWHYWFVIDALLVFIYVKQGLGLTACLFAAYLFLIVMGYRRWKATMVNSDA